MKQLLYLMAILTTCSSCDPSFPGEPLPGGNSPAAGPYFLNARLQFPDSSQAWALQWYADADPATPAGENGYLITHQIAAPTELYTVFDAGSVIIDTGAIAREALSDFEEEFGFSYGAATYAGLGFAFFHPDGEGPWDTSTVDAFFQAGRELSFGTGPGTAEVGYYKNWPGLLQSAIRGFLTSVLSNENGVLLVEDIREAEDDNGQLGRQVRLSFECRLYKQYQPETHLDVVGEAVVFIPVE